MCEEEYEHYRQQEEEEAFYRSKEAYKYFSNKFRQYEKHKKEKFRKKMQKLVGKILDF